MLGRHISRLGVSTPADKVDVVHRMAFPQTLNALESGTQFFNYYRKHVPHHSIIVDPLNRLKTLLFKTGPRNLERYRPKELCSAHLPLSPHTHPCNPEFTKLVDAAHTVLYCLGHSKGAYR